MFDVNGCFVYSPTSVCYSVDKQFLVQDSIGCFELSIESHLTGKLTK